MNMIANFFARTAGQRALSADGRQVSEPLDHPCLADLDSAAISDLPTTYYWIERQSGQIHLIGEDGNEP
jgi:hypothetical protein